MGKLALVLSGGGSKGAYEIGVYKALKRLHKDIKIVTGTSIGAINGFFIVQKDLRGAEKLWKQISFSTIYNEEDFDFKSTKLPDIYMQYVKSFITEGGMDVSKIEKVFDKFFKPNKFFKSKIDYGLVTYNMTENKPEIKTKKDLNKNNIRDYVIASASCYPAFKPHKINDKLYIDGGYYDNLPINLAIDLKADEVIAVDLKAVGLKKEVKDKNKKITYISPRNKIVSFLVFDKDKAKEALKFGYNDTMKTFGRLDGDKFTFKQFNIVENYNKYNEKFTNNLNEIFKNAENVILNKIFETNIIKHIINKQTLYPNFNYLVEKAGKIFNFDESTIYSIKSYNKGLLNSLYNTLPLKIEKLSNIKKITDQKQIVKAFYDAIKRNDKKLLLYIPLFSEEFLVAVYLHTIKDNKTKY